MNEQELYKAHLVAFEHATLDPRVRLTLKDMPTFDLEPRVQLPLVVSYRERMHRDA